MSDLYVWVKDELVIKDPMELPHFWKHEDGTISTGFNKMPVEELKLIGWLPVSVTSPVIDPAVEKRGDKEINIKTDSVEISWKVEDLTSAEKEEYQNEQIALLKTQERLYLNTNSGIEISILLIDLARWLLENTTMTLDDLSYEGKNAYISLNDRLTKI